MSKMLGTFCAEIKIIGVSSKSSFVRMRKCKNIPRTHSRTFSLPLSLSHYLCLSTFPYFSFSQNFVIYFPTSFYTSFCQTNLSLNKMSSSMFLCIYVSMLPSLPPRSTLFLYVPIFLSHNRTFSPQFFLSVCQCAEGTSRLCVLFSSNYHLWGILEASLPPILSFSHFRPLFLSLFVSFCQSRLTPIHLGICFITTHSNSLFYFCV